MKELNGKVERSHGIDEQLEEWLEEYNRHRPHGGLGFRTPVEKLKERLLNLGKEVLPKELEWMRNQFLMEAPARVLANYGAYHVKKAA